MLYGFVKDNILMVKIKINTDALQKA